VLILGEGMALSGLGGAFGAAAAFAITPALGGFLYGVSASDATLFLSSVAAMLVGAFAASYFPGRRAAATDPMLALRYG
jgi:ABC-type antimicrobial peptide transport system permease subunit